MEYIQTFDVAVLQSIIALRIPILNPIMIFISTIGNVGIVWLAIGVLMLFRRNSRAYGILLLLTVALSGLLNDVILKNIFERQRPFETIAGITALVPEPGSHSFPSGHTFASFAAAFVLVKYNKKIGIAAYILACLIGFSRLYLGVHYPTDVIAGAALGTLCGVVTCWLYNLFISYCHRNKRKY